MCKGNACGCGGGSGGLGALVGAAVLVGGAASVLLAATWGYILAALAVVAVAGVALFVVVERRGRPGRLPRHARALPAVEPVQLVAARPAALTGKQDAPVSYIRLNGGQEQEVRM